MSCTFVNPYDSDLKKRSGNDLVKSMVNSYLQRRHYMDTEHFRKSDLVLSQTSMQMTLDSSIDNDASRLNSIVYSTINNDTTLAEQQFTKLKSWVTDLPEGKCRYELQAMLFPLLCHLYLEISRGRLDKQATSKFLKPHQELYVGHESNQDLIEEISSVLSTQDIDTKPLTKAFRSCKYEMKVSSETMSALEKYLATCHAIILQVLQKWFDIEVLLSGSTLDSDGEDNDVTDGHAEFESLSQPLHEDKEMRHLQEAIRLVRASPTPPPPLLLYTLSNSESVSCAKVSRSGKLLATGYLSSALKLWSLSESKINPLATHNATVNLSTNTPPQTHVSQEQRFSSLRGHSGPVNGVEFVYDAELLLSVSQDCTMRAWKLSDYSPAAVYRGHNQPLWCVAASAFGVYVATGSHDSTARLWTLDRTFPLRIFAGHCHAINCVQFHPNNSYLATGSADCSIRLWSVTDGRLVRVYGNNSGSVLALAFSPNGQHLASSGDDRRVKVWDLASGGLLAELKGHSAPVTALHWSRDSNILASASLDGTILVWNSSLHFKPPVSESTENPAKYTSNCTSLLNLQCLSRGNLVAVGTV